MTTEDGFLIALPYGSRSSWLRNVLASGSATDQRLFRILGTRECLRLRRAPEGDAGSIASDRLEISGSPAAPLAT